MVPSCGDFCTGALGGGRDRLSLLQNLLLTLLLLDLVFFSVTGDCVAKGWFLCRDVA